MKKNIWNQLLTIAFVATVGSTTMSTPATHDHEKSSTYKTVLDKTKKFVQNKTIQKVAIVAGALAIIGASCWFLKSRWSSKAIDPIDKQPPNDPTAQKFQRPLSSTINGWALEKTVNGWALEREKCPHPPQEIICLSNGKKRIKIVHGDITEEGKNLKCAITNAANITLNGGGGIDGAIESAAGRAPYEECQAYKKQYNGSNDVPVGSATITGAGKLEPNVDYIIHTVGPQLIISNPKGQKATQKEKKQALQKNPSTQHILYAAVKNTLDKANQHGVQVVSIPSISSGIFNYPIANCTEQLLRAAANHFNEFHNTTIEEIRFTNVDQPTVQEFYTTIEKIRFTRRFN